MKKIVLFIVCLLCFQTNISAAEEVRIEKVETSYTSTKTSASGMTFTAPLYQLFVKGRIAYCIEPGVSLQEQIYQVDSDFSKIGISKELKKEMELIAYYGYQYKGHETLEYYMATQLLLWEKMGATNVSFADSGGNFISVDSFKDDILRKVSEHLSLPSFAFTVHTIRPNEELRLTDTNQVLYKYQLAKGQEGAIKENAFIVTQTKEEEREYLFESQRTYDLSLACYANQSQKVATFSLSDENISAFSIKVKTEKEKGSLIIKKIDATNKQGLKKAEFGLYDMENHFIAKGETGLDGTLSFNQIPYGKYYIKEMKAPKGYLKKEDLTFAEINQKETIIEISNQKYEMPITSNIDVSYYRVSIGLFLIGIGCVYVQKKIH